MPDWSLMRAHDIDCACPGCHKPSSIVMNVGYDVDEEGQKFLATELVSQVCGCDPDCCMDQIVTLALEQYDPALLPE